MKYILFLCSFCVSFWSCYAQKPQKIKPFEKISLSIPEPSDIVFDPAHNGFYIVSDNGFLFKTDISGTVLQQADYEGQDNEAVYVNSEFVYAVEERSRKIVVFKKSDLSRVATYHIPYSGGRNKGYEALTFNPEKNRWVILTEKDPIYLFELNEQFHIVNEFKLTFTRDISAATFYEGHLWLLSDEDRTVFKLHPQTYEVLEKWIVPIVNPEGICFDNTGTLYILSDNKAKLYKFQLK